MLRTAIAFLSLITLTQAISVRSEECWSKFEQQLFWKSSNYSVTPTLRKVLARYDSFHRRCREEEKGLNSSALEDAFMGRGTVKLSCKYVVWFPPYDGLGNRLVSLVSAYLFALLSRRVLIIDRRFELSQLFCNPFSNSDWMMTPLVRTDIMQKDSVKFNDWTKGSQDTTPAVLANINHEQDIKFFCSQELSRLSKVPLVLMESNMYFVPGLYYTSYRRRLEKLFPDRKIFTPLARKVLLPTNKIWARITKFYLENLKPADRRLGLQLRTRDAPWRIEKSRRLDRCIQKLGLLPSGRGTKVLPDGETSRLEHRNIAAFVATLKPEFVDHLKEEYGGKMGHGVTVKFHQATHHVEQDSSSESHNEDALVDIWLLSFNDDIVISHTSTFGYLASGLQGNPPIMVNHAILTEAEDQNSRMTDCDVAVTPEPCYHNPPFKVECPRDPTFTDPWNQDPAVRRCIDWIRGVQLVPS